MYKNFMHLMMQASSNKTFTIIHKSGKSKNLDIRGVVQILPCNLHRYDQREDMPCTQREGKREREMNSLPEDRKHHNNDKTPAALPILLPSNVSCLDSYLHET